VENAAIISVKVREVQVAKKRFGKLQFNPWNIVSATDLELWFKSPEAGAADPASAARAGKTVRASGTTLLRSLAATLTDWADVGPIQELRVTNLTIRLQTSPNEERSLRAGRATVTRDGVRLGGGVTFFNGDRVISAKQALLSANPPELRFPSGEVFRVDATAGPIRIEQNHESVN
jgi:hypothetical protein